MAVLPWDQAPVQQCVATQQTPGLVRSPQRSWDWHPVSEHAKNYQCDQGALGVTGSQMVLGWRWFNEPLTSAALGDVRVLSVMAAPIHTS